MRHLLPTLVFAGGLAGCANVHERPVDLGRIGLGPDDVLRIEREDHARRLAKGRRSGISAMEAVEALRCVARKQPDDIPITPKCDYRLRYRKLDGTSAVKSRKNRYFGRDFDGPWESVFVIVAS